MNGSGNNGPAGRSEEIRSAARTIRGEFDVAMGRADAVRAACDRIREALRSGSATTEEIEPLETLAPLLRKRSGEIAGTLFRLLIEKIPAVRDPWRFLEEMMDARDPALAREALAEAGRLAESGALRADDSVLRSIALRIEAEGSPFRDAGGLSSAAAVLRRSEPALRCPEGTGEDPAVALLFSGDPGARRLAALVADRTGEPVSEEIAARIVGPEAHEALAPYLAYTRAGALDLVTLAPRPGERPHVLESIRRAELKCGAALLRDVIAETGWARMSLGFDAREHVGIAIAGSFPLTVSPHEVSLFRTVEDASEVFRVFSFVCHGEGSATAPREETGDDPVARFRAYNLTHAEALAEILDMAPLTRDKVHRVLERMDRIVRDYALLFSRYSDECAALPDMYRELKAKVLAELEREDADRHLSAELTRLVQAFEDPRSLDRVRTLHGLKRYLHQTGLKLGFRLVETARATNRTVDIVLASPRRVLRVLRSIRYVDFEPDDAPAGEDAAPIPFPVRIAAEGFLRQAVHGLAKLPEVKVFCYGNEVHYFVAFGNHPAFLRIDFAPPARGGMIDLEYFGVSKYELGAHPNPSLGAIRLFFRHLEFDFQVENTHIHARYDKERALDLGDLCDKASALFRLVPYLMEVDWVIGSLALADEAKRLAAESWAASFARWGVLPVNRLLTKDRTGILVAVESDAAGTREIVWDGAGPYRDRFRAPPSASLLRKARAAMGDAAWILPHFDDAPSRPTGQIRLEESILGPLREAVSRGEIVETPEGYAPSPPDVAGRIDEAARFAEILAGGTGAIAASARLAAIVAPLEKTLRFATTGAVHGYEVQRARLTLRGEEIGLFILRDGGGVIRLALFARDAVLARRRAGPPEPWRENTSTDWVELSSLLRRSSYLAPEAESAPSGATDEAVRLLELFRSPNPFRRLPPLPGERVVYGLRASPGRAVGRAIMKSEGLDPQECDGSILLAPAVHPEDGALLYRSAGVLSTGGGVLSHAGLIALQFRKPSLIVPGKWERRRDGEVILRYKTIEYREECREVQGWDVAVRRDAREREHELRSGELVALDADEGTLRVLGDDAEALALHEGLRAFGEAARRLERATDEKEVLALRGLRLRARHQIERQLGRIADPVLARHAAHEILLGEAFAGASRARGEESALLALLLRNPSAEAAAREEIARVTGGLAAGLAALLEEARRLLPRSTFLHEILAVRLRIAGLQGALRGALESLRASGVETATEEPEGTDAIDSLARSALERSKKALAAGIEREVRAPGPRLRHLIRQAERLDLVLGSRAAPGGIRGRAREVLAAADEDARERAEGRRILRAEDGGFELSASIGWKAANLTEVERLVGKGRVPPWFVVTDRAFRETLEIPVQEGDAGIDGGVPPGSTLRTAIDRVLERGDLGDRERSSRISRLWENVRLPDAVATEVLEAYRALGTEEGGPASDGEAAPFVAIRSSALEEDAEAAARAGAFDTFLYIRGEASLLEHLKRAWSGLWSERALHSRAVLEGAREETGGGVIVQRIVRSRVSGVLLTVNAAERSWREMVVNAGLGLGEGVVSGAVAADQILVVKEGDPEKDPLRFRYITADKSEQVVFDEIAGSGTIRAETLYHQRLRAALEYVELRELVASAARLEKAYGYPLDIEFGVEGSRIWILQARPVAPFLAALRETVERAPIPRGRARPVSSRVKEMPT